MLFLSWMAFTINLERRTSWLKSNEPVLSGLLFCFRFTLVNVDASWSSNSHFSLRSTEGLWPCEFTLHFVRLLKARRDCLWPSRSPNHKTPKFGSLAALPGDQHYVTLFLQPRYWKGTTTYHNELPAIYDKTSIPTC